MSEIVHLNDFRSALTSVQIWFKRYYSNDKLAAA